MDVCLCVRLMVLYLILRATLTISESAWGSHLRQQAALLVSSQCRNRRMRHDAPSPWLQRPACSSIQHLAAFDRADEAAGRRLASYRVHLSISHRWEIWQRVLQRVLQRVHSEITRCAPEKKRRQATPCQVQTIGEASIWMVLVEPLKQSRWGPGGREPGDFKTN